MTDNEMCDEPYTRPLKLFPSDGLVVPVRCNFLKNHGANHSWYALQVADEFELERLRAETREATLDLPPHINTWVDEIEAGEHDPYVEVLLAALHGRKLARRGVAGFPFSRRI